jgi:hypothetical protein
MLQPLARRLTAGAIFVLLVGVVTVGSLGSDRRVSGSVIAPKEGVLLGGWSRPEGGRTYKQERVLFEDRVGRRFDAYRWWLTLDSVVDDQTLAFMRDLLGDRVPLVGFSLARRDGQATWGAIAEGRYDERIVATAEALERYGEPMVVVLDHEPEADVPEAGTPAEFRRMFRHVAGLFEEHATNVELAFVLTSMTYRQGEADRWYPGDDAVDWIGADGYNWRAGGEWRSCEDIFEAFYRFGAPSDGGRRPEKPLLIAEFGTGRDPAVPARRAQWLDECRRWVASRPAIKMVAYFHAYGWALDDDAQAMAAFRAWGASPDFRAGPG